MSSNTPNLGLLKKDPMVDGNETFNIKTMLNDNWDKIDEAVGNVKEDLGNVVVDIPDASLTAKGIVQLSNLTDGIREDIAPTELALKTVNDSLVSHKADYVSHPANGGATSGTSTAYTCNSSPNPTTLVDKTGLVITVHVDSGANPTLKWGSLAAKSIKKPNGSAAKLKKDGLYSLRYNSVNDSFILQGEGGEYGTAGPAQVLSGYTVGQESGVVPGAMPNRGAPSFNPTTTPQSIPSGYYSGGTITSVGVAKYVDTEIIMGGHEETTRTISPSAYGLTGFTAISMVYLYQDGSPSTYGTVAVLGGDTYGNGASGIGLIVKTMTSSYISLESRRLGNANDRYKTRIWGY